MGRNRTSANGVEGSANGRTIEGVEGACESTDLLSSSQDVDSGALPGVLPLRCEMENPVLVIISWRLLTDSTRSVTEAPKKYNVREAKNLVSHDN